jgi:hypothetical protein
VEAGKNSPDADTMTTGEEAEPTPCVVHMRNVGSRSPSCTQEGISQGTPTGGPVEEEGASEGRSVMERIGVAAQEKITPRESEQTSLWSFRARAFEQPIEEVRQMTTEATEVPTPDPSVGATTNTPLTWHQINWRQAERNVHRLQTRMAQATLEGKWNRVKALQHLLTHSRERQSVGRAASDGEHWQTHPGC